MRGEFQRTVSLPDNVDDANAKASFKDGILTVTLPKTEKKQAQNHRDQIVFFSVKGSHPLSIMED